MKLCCFYINSMNTSPCIWSPWKKHPLQLGLQDQQVGRSAPPKTESCRLAQWPKSPKWQENHHGNRSNNTELSQLYRTVQNHFFIWGALEIWFDEICWATVATGVQTQESIGDLIRKDMATRRHHQNRHAADAPWFAKQPHPKLDSVLRGPT